MNNPENIQILDNVTEILEKLKIKYAIGGSMASSLYGTVRFTEDADITIEPFGASAEKLLQAFGRDYYISAEAMYNALKNHNSFNIIHIESAFKIDIFICKDEDFEKQLFARTNRIKLSDSPDKLFSVVSPEDIILLKLKWYHDSNCVSEKQWNDILGVLQTQGEKLDTNYLRTWSVKLNIDTLLTKAIAEK